MGIVKKDPTRHWGLKESRDWVILGGKPTLLNAERKSPSQHDWVWKRAGISDVDNKSC